MVVQLREIELVIDVWLGVCKYLQVYFPELPNLLYIKEREKEKSEKKRQVLSLPVREESS